MSSPSSRQALQLVRLLRSLIRLDGRKLPGPVQRDGAEPLVRAGPGRGQGRVKERAADRNRAAHQPERGQGSGQPQCQGRVTPLVLLRRGKAPVQAGQEVVLLGFEHVQPGCLIRSGQVSLAGEVQQPGQMPLPHR
jgi:hypothetical protein